ncbi:Hypothetical protein CINCED_3A001660 [Cinara cedri]|uniref:RNA 3'-terminal phosphate cyclase n=1 Tax=Cinara cedri TaxID=506608 RepID=A0A5E4MX03_9HEMI|nr:Hypothetical protein CINCED_3A001660 [Cinara cedri]
MISASDVFTYPRSPFSCSLPCSLPRKWAECKLDRNMAVKEIDGSKLEGGGQVIRLSVALSCLLEQPIQIIKIRAGRSNPGLKPQHIAGIYLVKEMCKGVTRGDQQNSCVLSFEPQSLSMGNFNLNVDSRTAASISLMIQSVLPVAIFSNCSSTITMKGGTDVRFAPPMDYVINVLFPLYHKLFGISCDIHINKRGFYPRGGGDVKFTVNPLNYNGYLKPIEMIDSGSSFESTIRGIIFITEKDTAPVVGQPRLRGSHSKFPPTPSFEFAYDIGVLIKKKLRQFSYNDVKIEINVEKSNVFHGSVVLVAESEKCFIGSSIIYDERKSLTDIVMNVCDKFLMDLMAKSCVDENTMDNLIIFMALANGKSKVKCREITLHTKTAIHIAEQLTNAKFQIKQTEDRLNEIVCEGIGFKRHII